LSPVHRSPGSLHGFVRDREVLLVNGPRIVDHREPLAGGVNDRRDVLINHVFGHFELEAKDVQYPVAADESEEADASGFQVKPVLC